MTTTTLVPGPLVIALIETECDGRHAHPVVLFTDGHTAYAEAAGSGYQAAAYHRHGTEVTAICGQPTAPGEAASCDGVVTVDLATEGVWRPATNAHRALLRYQGDTVTAVS